MYEEAITKIFTDSNGTYGPDRVCGVLRRQGYTASYKRVARIMKKLGLSSIHNRRRQRSLTDSRKTRGKQWPNLICDLEARSEEHTSELQSRPHLVCRLLL